MNQRMNQQRVRLTTVPYGVLCLTLLLLYAPPANGQCQNQLCKWDDSQKQGCWQCGSGAGFGCRVESCTSCTNTTCGGLMVGWMAPGFSYVAQCLLPAEQSQPIADEGTIGIAAQEGAPAVLVVATHDTADLFAGGKLMNTGKNTIISYKLGWVVLQPQSKPSSYAGEWMAVPTGHQLRSHASDSGPGRAI